MADYQPGQPLEDILASIRKVITDGGPAPASVEPHAVPPESDEEAEEVLELGEPVAPVSMARAPEPASPPEAPLISGKVEAASRQALAALASVAIDPGADPNTLDGLVREMLRPMLKKWLDQNLPTIVERLVAREISRLGGR